MFSGLQCKDVLDNISPEPNSGCWLWTLRTDRNGYARLTRRINGEVRGFVAHRVAYGLFVGSIPRGLELDHKCRVRSCVNPDHLEPVSHRTNVIRGVSFGAVNAKKTHCSRGHEFTAANTYIRPSGGRDCRICGAERQRQCSLRRNKAA